MLMVLSAVAHDVFGRSMTVFFAEFAFKNLKEFKLFANTRAVAYDIFKAGK